MPKLKEDKKTKYLSIKISESDHAKIILQAKKYTGGNVSRWIRYAAIKLTPKKEDLYAN